MAETDNTQNPAPTQPAADTTAQTTEKLGQNKGIQNSPDSTQQDSDLEMNGANFLGADANGVFLRINDDMFNTTYEKYSDPQKLAGLQMANSPGLEAKSLYFKQDYIVLIRKKFYFASNSIAALGTEENQIKTGVFGKGVYTRSYKIDNFYSMSISHSVNGQGRCSIQIMGGQRVTKYEHVKTPEEEAAEKEAAEKAAAEKANDTFKKEDEEKSPKQKTEKELKKDEMNAAKKARDEAEKTYNDYKKKQKQQNGLLDAKDQLAMEEARITMNTQTENVKQLRSEWKSIKEPKVSDNKAANAATTETGATPTEGKSTIPTVHNYEEAVTAIANSGLTEIPEKERPKENDDLKTLQKKVDAAYKKAEKNKQQDKQETDDEPSTLADISTAGKIIDEQSGTVIANLGTAKNESSWVFAEKADWEPNDEIFVFGRSQFERMSTTYDAKYVDLATITVQPCDSKAFKYNQLFFGYISEISHNISPSGGFLISISCEDQLKLLAYSYISTMPSVTPGINNNGKFDLRFSAPLNNGQGMLGLVKYYNPAVLAAHKEKAVADAGGQTLEDAEKNTRTHLAELAALELPFGGKYAHEIITSMCQQAGVPQWFLTSRIEPIKFAPYVFKIRSNVQSIGQQAHCERRLDVCKHVVDKFFLEFFADECGNIVLKCPNYALGVNRLLANNMNISAIRGGVLDQIHMDHFDTALYSDVNASSLDNSDKAKAELAGAGKETNTENTSADGNAGTEAGADAAGQNTGADATENKDPNSNNPSTEESKEAKKPIDANDSNMSAKEKAKADKAKAKEEAKAAKAEAKAKAKAEKDQKKAEKKLEKAKAKAEKNKNKVNKQEAENEKKAETESQESVANPIQSSELDTSGITSDSKFGTTGATILTHTISAADTMYSICMEYYGHCNDLMARNIYKDNVIKFRNCGVSSYEQIGGAQGETIWLFSSRGMRAGGPNDNKKSSSTTISAKSIEDYKKNMMSQTITELTDSLIPEIPPQFITNLSLKESDSKIYNNIQVNIVGDLNIAEADKGQITSLSAVYYDLRSMLKYGVRTMADMDFPRMGTKENAYLLGYLICCKSMCDRFNGSLTMIEDSFIKVGNPVRITVYDDYPEKSKIQSSQLENNNNGNNSSLTRMSKTGSSLENNSPIIENLAADIKETADGKGDNQGNAVDTNSKVGALPNEDNASAGNENPEASNNGKNYVSTGSVVPGAKYKGVKASEFAKTTTAQAIYYVESISRNINVQSTSTMTLTLTAGRMMGMPSNADYLMMLYKAYYFDAAGYAPDIASIKGLIDAYKNNKITINCKEKDIRTFEQLCEKQYGITFDTKEIPSGLIDFGERAVEKLAEAEKNQGADSPKPHTQALGEKYTVYTSKFTGTIDVIEGTVANKEILPDSVEIYIYDWNYSHYVAVVKKDSNYTYFVGKKGQAGDYKNWMINFLRELQDKDLQARSSQTTSEMQDGEDDQSDQGDKESETIEENDRTYIRQPDIVDKANNTTTEVYTSDDDDSDTTFVKEVKKDTKTGEVLTETTRTITNNVDENTDKNIKTTDSEVRDKNGKLLQSDKETRSDDNSIYVSTSVKYDNNGLPSSTHQSSRIVNGNNEQITKQTINSDGSLTKYEESRLVNGPYSATRSKKETVTDAQGNTTVTETDSKGNTTIKATDSKGNPISTQK